MAGISIRPNDSFEMALRRFKRACEKEGILGRLRQLEAYEKPTTKRKRKGAAAIKREIKRREKEAEKFGTIRQVSKKKKRR